MIMTKPEMTKRIAQIEMTIQRALSEGHKCSNSDQFQPLRLERDILKSLLAEDFRPEPYK